MHVLNAFVSSTETEKETLDLYQRCHQSHMTAAEGAKIHRAWSELIHAGYRRAYA